jgi:DNA polymerase I-like protein with 3'-5' exonuclease and polymerase domains
MQDDSVHRKFLWFDIEANGLTPDLIHCISIGDDNGIVLYGPSEISEAVQRLSSASVLCGHGVLSYDLPVLRRLAQLRFSGRVVDTLTCTSLLWPDAEGGHSLEAWGKRLGVFKGDYQGPWDVYSERMGEYCKQDVAVTIRLWQHIKKELDSHDWSRALRLEHRIAEIMHQQAVDGWKFDVEKAKQLVVDIDVEVAAIDSQLETIINRKCKKKGATVEAPFKKDGKHKAIVVERYGEEGCAHVAGPYSPVVFEFPNLSSRDQLAELLQSYGWKPTEYTETGKPKVTEESLESAVGEAGSKIAKRFKLLKRRSEIEGWLENVRPDGRIEARAFPQATPTGRMRHRNVVNVPKAHPKILYGHECRSLFTVGDGKTLVGVDASGLELRMLAHYMGDMAFTEQILRGDVHTYNQNLAGLETRDQAKTFIYALLYGAGDAKIGSVVGGTKKDGAILRGRFLDNLPAYATLLTKVTSAASRGYLLGLDGRKIPIRSEHAALNSLLQCAGSVVVKTATARMHQLWLRDGIYAKQVGHFHDECQIEADASQAEAAGQAFIEGLKWTQEYYKLRCPLDGEVKRGLTWAMTH